MSGDGASPRAGQPAERDDLIDVNALLTAYTEIVPDPGDPAQQVAFGTSGHRGSAFDGAFNEVHIAAITQAVCEYRRAEGVTGPLFLGADTHALSAPAMETTLAVLAANDVEVLIDRADRPVPTPSLSHAIVTHNRDGAAPADGVVLTPSHNPPRDGGYKYNPPHGGPADSDVTGRIGRRANELMAEGRNAVRRARPDPGRYDFLERYVDDLPSVVDLDAVRSAAVRIGADPLGGASVDYWTAIAERHRLDVTVTNPVVDPTWRFMTLDRDGKIRMDCSSPWCMATLVATMASSAERFDLAVGNDADADRHGIVTPDAGLMNPNHYLAVAIRYLFEHRAGWPPQVGVGKTLVSSAMIDRVAELLGRALVEVPVGFKWYVEGLADGSLGFGGEESAGASFLRTDGTVWTTDKDGILLALLAAEITAVTGRSPSDHYRDLTERFGDPAYERIDAPATPAQKSALGRLQPDAVTPGELAGEEILQRLTEAPGNKAPIGGLKVVTDHAWFAARPSGTEDVYKIYAESFRGPEHLARVQEEARSVVSAALEDAGGR